MKCCRSLWTKISIQGINRRNIFRFNIDSEFTLCFLQLVLGGKHWGIYLRWSCYNFNVTKIREDKGKERVRAFSESCVHDFGGIEEEGERETFEKWYSLGNDTLRYKFPSLDELPLTTTVCVSADGRLLRRLKDLDFGVGGWTPFSSKVRISAFALFKSRYLITLLFVSAIKSFPTNQ